MYIDKIEIGIQAKRKYKISGIFVDRRLYPIQGATTYYVSF